MMITPALVLPNGQRPTPFAEAGVAIVNSLELQIPFARDLSRPGNITYITADFQFEERQTHARISYGINFFHHAQRPRNPDPPERLRETEVGPYDAPSHSFQVGNAIAPRSRVVTMLAGSASQQSQPWKGWRLFNFAITRNNFKTALLALKEKAPGFAGSDNPADYELSGWHLNAELQFASGPAELGWSMRRARVEFARDDRL
jgi:hypothetical protein